MAVVHRCVCLTRRARVDRGEVQGLVFKAREET